MKQLKIKIWDREQNRFIESISIFRELFINNGEIFELMNPKVESDIHNRFDICLYTGIKDDNGNEIYDGDVVLFQNGRGVDIRVVRWAKKEAMFRLIPIGYDPNADIEFIKVIGNIYENPELVPKDEVDLEEETISNS